MASKPQSAERDPRHVTTTPFRMSFPYLLTPRKDEKTGRVTYSLTMLFPPGTNLEPFRAALKAAMTEKFGPEQKKWPNVRHTPRDVIRDFEAYNAAAKKPLDGDWRGWTIIRANCSDKWAPNIVGPTRGQDGFFPRITEPREVYGGRWACATLQAFYFPVQGAGVTFGLQNVQLLKHDKPFGMAQAKPEDEFEDAPEEWSGTADYFERGGNNDNVVPMRGQQQARQPANDDWGGAPQSDASPW